MAKSSRYDMPSNPKAHKSHGVEVQRGPIKVEKTMQTKTHRDFAREEVEMMDMREANKMPLFREPG